MGDGGFVIFCGGNEGWIGRGMGCRIREDKGGMKLFMGGMVAREGDFWQWEGGTKGGGVGPRMREDKRGRASMRD